MSRRFTVYKPAARAERHRDECGEDDGESSEEEVGTFSTNQGAGQERLVQSQTRKEVSLSNQK